MKQQIENHYLLMVLKQPSVVVQFSVEQWNVLLFQAKQAGMLATLANCFQQQQVWQQLPEAVQGQCQDAMQFAQYLQRNACWEINRLRRVLYPAGYQMTLLKGAAYLYHKIPVSEGRLLADVDLLFNEADLPAIETLLIANGWECAKQNEYDKAYYRQWMHELPPYRHRERLYDVDIHHRILPRTSRLNPDPSLLLTASISLAEPGLNTLCFPDMVLHAVVHLGYDADYHNRIRDLYDIDQLLRYGEQHVPDFWLQLQERALKLGVTLPLIDILWLLEQFFATPVNELLLRGLPKNTTRTFQRIKYWALPEAMLPLARGQKRIQKQIASQLLYLRSHWLKMPLLLLLNHLSRKAWMRVTGKA
ncbi:nucleotidyltransferase family protein [Endozoicomonas sp. SM1973]|uniref:Nucleotidyltransferase family protein n=1 Tax=Spartinivicinus marinus TaxID=2994442 RepID=A0A853III9_9GAMM|nr:nucleotidyltransferase family protein [Spartinivicinus marinus]MCX4025342.1 nucleotidyltransferase family protein [Spartinivicinus marinus]NYZ68915.1 nucleotidyltransferase family protein [Spartinivicinus marinus]